MDLSSDMNITVVYEADMWTLLCSIWHSYVCVSAYEVCSVKVSVCIHNACPCACFPVDEWIIQLCRFQVYMFMFMFSHTLQGEREDKRESAVVVSPHKYKFRGWGWPSFTLFVFDVLFTIMRFSNLTEQLKLLHIFYMTTEKHIQKKDLLNGVDVYTVSAAVWIKVVSCKFITTDQWPNQAPFNHSDEQWTHSDRCRGWYHCRR